LLGVGSAAVEQDERLCQQVQVAEARGQLVQLRDYRVVQEEGVRLVLQPQDYYCEVGL
jgi:hypothetical protein